VRRADLRVRGARPQGHRAVQWQAAAQGQGDGGDGEVQVR